MADAAKFDIDIEAKSIGVDSTNGQLNTLAARIRGADVAATKWDTAVAASTKRLQEASAAAKLAADSLGLAEMHYGELESAANKAAKELEKATSAGKDTAALRASAEAATAAMRAQGAAVDELREKSKAASDTEKALANTHKTLTGEQSKAQAAAKKFNEEVASKKINDSIAKQEALTSGALAVASAYLIAGLAILGAVGALGHFAVASNPAAMLRLNMASARLELGFKKLFRGLNLDNFVGSLEKVMALFDEGNASAKGMKRLVETIFQPLFDSAAKAGPYVAEMFKGMIHGALLVVIAVLSIRNAIFRALSPETRKGIQDFVDKIFTLENAFKVGEIAALAFAAAFVVLGVAALIAMLPLIVMAAVVWAAIYGIAKAWDYVKIALYALLAISALVLAAVLLPFIAIGAAIAGFFPKAKQWGKDLIAGFIAGITGQDTEVRKAMSVVGGTAELALKARLQQHSPSRLFAEIGHYTVLGYVQGVEDDTPLVGSALERMVSTPDGYDAGRGAASSSSVSSSHATIIIEHLTVGDSPVAQTNLASLKAMLLDLVDGARITIGGAEAPA